ncbi:MAG: hypothetical protein Q8J65_05515 [Nitrosomonadales bacterium]|nr:hypothetical protein [Nitrosomonadales bacterium]
MKKINEFSLEQHEGEYNTWPLQSMLLRHGQPTGLYLPGYELLHQFVMVDGLYFFITDWDCPFEEMTHFILVSPSMKKLAWRQLGGMYQSFLLCHLEVLDQHRLHTYFADDRTYDIQIRPWGIPFIYPRISLKRGPDEAWPAKPASG